MGFPGGASGKEPPANAGDIRDAGGEDPLEEGVAPHSSILASRIPWTEEPGRLQSTRVRYFYFYVKIMKKMVSFV